MGVPEGLKGFKFGIGWQPSNDDGAGSGKIELGYNFKNRAGLKLELGGSATPSAPGDVQLEIPENLLVTVEQCAVFPGASCPDADGNGIVDDSDAVAAAKYTGKREWSGYVKAGGTIPLPNKDAWVPSVDAALVYSRSTADHTAEVKTQSATYRTRGESVEFQGDLVVYDGKIPKLSDKLAQKGLFQRYALSAGLFAGIQFQSLVHSNEETAEGNLCADTPEDCSRVLTGTDPVTLSSAESSDSKGYGGLHLGGTVEAFRKGAFHVYGNLEGRWSSHESPHAELKHEVAPGQSYNFTELPVEAPAGVLSPVWWGGSIMASLEF